MFDSRRMFRTTIIVFVMVFLPLMKSSGMEAATVSKSDAPVASSPKPDTAHSALPLAPAKTYNPRAHRGGMSAMLVLGTQLQGVGVRYYLTPTLALQGLVGSVPKAGGVLAGVDALVERPVLLERASAVLSWRAGAGVAAGSMTVADQAVSLGYFSGLVGVSADAREWPVSVGLDLRGGLMQAGLARQEPVGRFGMSAELGVHYYFR